MIALAALLTGALVWWLVAPGGGSWMSRLGPVVESRQVPRRNGLLVVAAGLAVVTVVALVWGTGAAGIAAVIALMSATVGWLVHDRRRATAEIRHLGEVAEACRVLGSLVHIGHVPATALRLAAVDAPVLATVASAQSLGGRVPAALRALSDEPGREGFARVAEAWAVCEETGAPIAPTLAVVSDELRVERELASTVAGELAGPRASGKVLAALPFVGLAMGYGLGGDPIRFLTTGLIGPACLVAGVGLACAGMIWTEILVCRAERRRRPRLRTAPIAGRAPTGDRS